MNMNIDDVKLVTEYDEELVRLAIAYDQPSEGEETVRMVDMHVVSPAKSLEYYESFADAHPVLLFKTADGPWTLFTGSPEGQAELNAILDRDRTAELTR
jgi:hypothetical protein